MQRQIMYTGPKTDYRLNVRGVRAPRFLRGGGTSCDLLIKVRAKVRDFGVKSAK